MRRQAPKPRPWLPVLAGLILLAIIAGGLFAFLRAGGERAAGGGIGGPFQLMATDGRSVTDRDLHGHFALIYFGYASCPDICPTTLATVTAALGQIGPARDRLRPVFITIDPARDTPDLLHRYLAAFSPAFLGLTGSPAALKDVETAYHVTVHIPTAGETGAIDHSAALYLMAPDGRFLAPFPITMSAADLATGLRRYID